MIGSKIENVFRIFFVIMIIAGLNCTAYTLETDDSWSTNTETYIQYNALGLIKIEIPKFPPREEILETKKEKSGNTPNIEKNFYFFFPASIEKVTYPPYKAIFAGFVKIPFFTSINSEQMFRSFEKKKYNKEDNPLVSAWQLDKPLFSILHGFTITNTTEPEEENNYIKHIKRGRFIDSIVFSFIKYDEWSSKKSDPSQNFDFEFTECLFWEVLKIKNRESKTLWSCLDVPLFTGCEGEMSKSVKDINLCDVAVAGSLYTQKNRPGISNKWTLLDLLCFNLINNQTENKNNKFTIAEAFTSIHFISFAMFEARENMKIDGYQFIRIPVIGPIFSIWKNQDDSDRGFCLFPRLFMWGSSDEYSIMK